MRTYQELLRTQRKHIERSYLLLLRKIYREHPGLALHEEFAKLDARVRAVEGLAAGEGEADAESCAAAQGFLEGVEDQLAALYWKARVELLLTEF